MSGGWGSVSEARPPLRRDDWPQRPSKGIKKSIRDEFPIGSQIGPALDSLMPVNSVNPWTAEFLRIELVEPRFPLLQGIGLSRWVNFVVFVDINRAGNYSK